MKKPVTTFIIPTVGRPTLKRAIRSVPPEAEYIVMRDTKRQGPAVMRNQAIDQVNTEYVSFLDDDDTVTSDYVDKLCLEIANATAEGKEPDLIVFREYFIKELMDTNVTEDHFIWRVPEIKWGEIGIAFTVKTHIARELPFRTEKYEDFEFVKRVSEAGYNVLFSKYITYHGRH